MNLFSVFLLISVADVEVVGHFFPFECGTKTKSASGLSRESETVVGFSNGTSDWIGYSGTRVRFLFACSSRVYSNVR